MFIFSIMAAIVSDSPLLRRNTIGTKDQSVKTSKCENFKIGAVKDPGFVNRPESRQQDDMFIFSDDFLVVMGVFDGHDRENGKIVSNVVKKSIYHDLIENREIVNSINDDLINCKVYLDEVFTNANQNLKNFLIEKNKKKGRIVTEDNGYPVYQFGENTTKINIRGGTTVSLVIIINNQFLITANVGDSTIFMCGNNVNSVPESKITSTFNIEDFTENYAVMSPGHSATDLAEYLRIKEFCKNLENPMNHFYDNPSGFKYTKPCFFQNNKLDKLGFYYKNVRNEFASLVHDPTSGCMLAMTRAIGDYPLQAKGLSFLPDVAVYNLEKIKQNSDSLKLMICSDGIWDCWNYEEIISFFKTIESTNNVDEIEFNIDDNVQGTSAGMIAITERFIASNKLKATRLFGSSCDNMAAIICEL